MTDRSATANCRTGDSFLHEYAYDWRDNLVDLARGFIDYQSRAEEIRRGGREPGRGE